MDKSKTISEEGIKRNVKAFCDFVQKSEKYGAKKILAMATSAVRDAKNKDEFIQTIYQKTGINIKIISGEEEAELGYKGVMVGIKQGTFYSVSGSVNQKNCPLNSEIANIGGGKTDELFFNNPADSVIVIDIGGGSTELTLGEGGTFKRTISLDIGAVRMTERFITTDPIDKKEYKKMNTEIYNTIKKVKQEIIFHNRIGNQTGNRPVTTVGIGGTITTLAALHQKLDPYDPQKVHNYKLTLENINNLKEELLSLTINQIKQLKGIHPKRADIIAAGVTILSIIMDSLNLKEIMVSEYDNLEGLLESYI